jgi:hypothetical protein
VCFGLDRSEGEIVCDALTRRGQALPDPARAPARDARQSGNAAKSGKEAPPKPEEELSIDELRRQRWPSD